MIGIRALGVVLMLLMGCNNPSPSPADETPPAKSADVSASRPASSAQTAKKAKFPPEARRNSAPAGIADALQAGATAPAMKAITATTGSWSLGEKTTVLVFYRGHW